VTWGDYWGSLYGDAIAWGDREDGDDGQPGAGPRKEIPVGLLDTFRTADERVWKQLEGVAGQVDVHRVLADLAMDHELVTEELLMQRFVRFAEGYWLDAIGQSIGLARGGMTDDELYRLAIIAESLSQVATCVPNETIDLVARLAHDGADVFYSEHYPLGFSVAVPDLSAERFDLMRNVLADAIAATVGAGLETYPSVAPVGGHAVAGWDYPPMPGFDGTLPPPQLREYDSASLLSAPNDRTLIDPIGPDVITADGSTYVPAFDLRSYDGVSNRIDQPNVFDLGTVPTAHSGVCWARPSTVAAGFAAMFVNSNLVPQQSVIFRRSGAGIEFTHAYSATSLRRVSADVLAVDTLAMLGWSYDGSGLASGIRLYINGAEVGSYVTSTDGVGTPRTADGLWSWGGRADADANMWAGLLGRGRIYDGVLPASAFRRIYVMNIVAGRVSPFGSWAYASGTDDVRALWSHAATLGS
jgi:hypothetical protein